MITDDILVLYHLNDGLDASVREAVETTLARDPVLRERLARLAADISELSQIETIAVPDDTQRRWHAALERAAATTKQEAAKVTKPVVPRRPWYRQWATIGTVAASSLVVLIGVRLLLPATPTAVATDPSTTAAASDGNVRFERSVRLYLAEARRQVETLAELPANEREEVLNLVLTHNRLYIAAAERAASPTVARSLRALNPVLETLEDEGMDRTALQGGIAQVGFEMKVIQARLAQRAPAPERAGSRLLAL
jgi:negative regulator of sigma E activity